MSLDSLYSGGWFCLGCHCLRRWQPVFFAGI